MGREDAHDPNQLRRLKGSMDSEIGLLTYDDLADGLAQLTKEMRRDYRP
jgi:hypothetical protein